MKYLLFRSFYLSSLILAVGGSKVKVYKVKCCIRFCDAHTKRVARSTVLFLFSSFSSFVCCRYATKHCLFAFDRLENTKRQKNATVKVKRLTILIVGIHNVSAPMNGMFPLNCKYADIEHSSRMNWLQC